MTKISRVLITALAILSLVSCIPKTVHDPETGRDIFKIADTFYQDIKVIVQDPYIRSSLSAKALEKLSKAEKVYLAARSVYQKSGAEDLDALSLLASSGDEIISVLDTLVLDGKTQEKVALARMSLKLFRNHLPVVI